MLEIIDSASRDDIRRDCGLLGIPYEDGRRAFHAVDGQDTVGFCVYGFEADRLVIKGVRCEPEYGTSLYDGLLRAVLNLALSRGVGEAVLDDAIPEEVCQILLPLHFTKNIVFSIEDFFKTFRNCRK
ncbi:hypothetical protein [Candidatus Soleaferrea massiliensis]|uniref:hypothetical protein n=1 Tax=Candidatus Soleaferrea massiliensis TaxID=1470354 RepID=UPI00059100E4|nr:hypothetical protein [Candidatus Soleaferrea massiliensis]